MRQFKIRQGKSVDVFEINYDNYKKALPNKPEEKEKYFVDTPQGKRPIAVCPSCDNPVRLFGLAKPIEKTTATGKKVLVHPYGKHWEHDTEIAKYNEKTYKYCPLSSGYRMSNKEDKYDEPTQLNIELYQSLKENFDSAIYILSKSLGLWINERDAREILKGFLEFEGYMHVDTHYYNIPYMLFYLSFRTINIWHKRIIPGSTLHNFLKKQKNIKLVPQKNKEGNVTYYVVEGNGVFINNAIVFGKKRVSVSEDGDINETYGLNYYVSNWEQITIGKIKVDTDWYNNLSAKKYRTQNMRLLAIAEELMTKY